MKKQLLFAAAFVLAIGLVSGLTSGLTPALASEPVVFTAVVPTPVYIPIVAPVKKIYVPGIAKASGGRLTVNLKGGPEVIPADNQVDAVRKGIIDMAFTWVSDYRHLVPVAGVIHLSPFSPWEERENKVFDYLVKIHKKINIQYIGRWGYGMSFNFHMREKKITNISDFKGIKMDDPINIPAIPKAFGMIPVNIDGPEIFTAMERGVIDGYVWSDFGKYPGWEKVTKYVVDAPFLNMDMVILVNQKKYNKLSNDLKDVLSKYTMQFEREAAAWYAEGVVKERKKYEDAGCTYIKLSSKEEKHLAEAAEKAAWEKDVRPIVSQKEYDEARAILIK